MYALTLWQPWCWLVSAGIKRVENRPWEPPSELIGQRFALHAGKKWDDDGSDWIDLAMIDDPIQYPDRSLIPFGAITATARLVCVATNMETVVRHAGGEQRRWFFGPYGWILDDIRQVTPIPCRGFQKLWGVPPEIEMQLREAA